MISVTSNSLSNLKLKLECAKAAWLFDGYWFDEGNKRISIDVYGRF